MTLEQELAGRYASAAGSPVTLTKIKQQLTQSSPAVVATPTTRGDTA